MKNTSIGTIAPTFFKTILTQVGVTVNRVFLAVNSSLRTDNCRDVHNYLMYLECFVFPLHPDVNNKTFV